MPLGGYRVDISVLQNFGAVGFCGKKGIWPTKYTWRKNRLYWHLHLRWIFTSKM